MDPSEMTPEQMAALAKQQCIFCQIASGKVASKKVYEDEHVIAVLDINPANPGHVLLITKEHYVVMPQIPDDVVAHIGMVTKGISHALLRALKAQGTTIFVANGVTAGQRAQHFMLHIIPRMEGDGVGIDYPEHEISAKDYKKILTALRKGVAKSLGKVEGLEEESEKEEEMIEEAEEKLEEKKEKKKEEKAEAEEEKEEQEEPEEEKEEEHIPEEEEPSEAEEEMTLEAAAKGAKAKKKKKAKKKAKKKTKKKVKKEVEPEEEIDEERQKLDQIANLLT
ncbi:HIT family protein [Candidatus Woesearchaeota archaeon]|nr:HIT family protein [Candidatus Woesearchaeota archaeon]